MRGLLDLNEGIWEFCKYQNDLLKQYKEYIEKTIHAKILEKFDISAKDSGQIWSERECRIHEIKIPETRFVILETPNVKRQWDILNWEQPLIKPEVYLNVLYKAMEEQNNVSKTD